jgi:hypothetical protein
VRSSGPGVRSSADSAEYLPPALIQLASHGDGSEGMSKYFQAGVCEPCYATRHPTRARLATSSGPIVSSTSLSVTVAGPERAAEGPMVGVLRAEALFY